MACKEIPLEATTPQADMRTEPIMSWLDLTDLDPDTDNSTESETLVESTDIFTKESTLQAAFVKEITELFAIPKD